ncbi:MAG: phosphoribosyl-AMP cyclohydrolase / phosphoribosyl-ATP pyrophosphohydrolase [Tenuifilum sp.]|jgi:phosphoribosyl-ATP pyrophosphohydrolase/phosphoribosyl-AMP cyclohydrolase|uniref:bifunctional phosphoribosyl-AMP cyclohydrolase/phosphoribosyl-ATP diphosphatase HisIE n=1 Tax=Tenuifilum sp. TaxID=2760880 RepID=UPI0024AC3E3C|nr:bifunctional phosphoribosyl-AMP cyclohydrolase/phosphoribosyl-ATP diphosphatase HisIE [Tenuifilum sp.]MDI3527917.1 phosphoribosyl-AMP cyclohydrolase / phosphoribosyl-ATP pyrophosphohydrolase [Tenuifilum sp.]
MTTLNFDKLNGLIPAIIQDAATNRVLMLGFMNREALEVTRKTGLATFYSRTRRQIWTKGETSGNYLKVAAIIPDCDGDTLLVKVNPQGPVCHTGNDTCFNEINRNSLGFIEYLESVIESRKDEQPDSSYTAKLFSAGNKRIAKKIGEEAVELALESETGSDERLLDETADLIYHTLVLLASRNLKFENVIDVLKNRHADSKASNDQIDNFKRGEKQWGK